MKMKKQKSKGLLSILLAVAMMLTLLPTAAFAASYNDTGTHWASGEIEKWSNYGILQGSGGNFRPDASITRAEMATILDKVMKYQVKGQNSFTDLTDTWYTDAVLRTNAAGIILGSGGQVRPTDNISRQEAAIMLCRALGVKEVSGSTTFADDSQVDSWAKGYVKALSEKGLMGGIGNNCFAPKADITRASVIKMLDNGIKGLYQTSGEYTTNVAGNVVINTPNVTLKDMEIKGDLIIAEGVGNGDVKLDNIKITGNTIVKGGGKNSLYFNSVTIGGALIVNKVGGDLRIVATGSTSVAVAVLESGAILVAKELVGGGIEKVEIPASVAAGQNIVLDGNFKTVVNNGTSVNIQATGKIDNLVLNEKTSITGTATITNVTVAPGADSTINDKPATSGQTNVPGTTPPTTGGGGGNSGGNDDSSTSTKSTTPTIGTQPTGNDSAVFGDTVTLTIAAAGSGTLTYQWYSNTINSNTSGTAISGATSPIYTVPTTAVADQKWYYCVVTNTQSGKSGTTATSNAVSVTVNPAIIPSPIIVSITAPAKNGTPQTSITTGTGYTGTITWNGTMGSGGKFAAFTVYTADIVLTANDNYKFSTTSPTVNGTNGTVSAETVTGGDVAGNGLTFTVTYEQTSDKEASTLTFDGLTNGILTKTFGDDKFTKAATKTGSSASTTYASSAADVANVDGSTGEVTIYKIGTAVITASIAADNTYEATTATYTLNINPKTLSTGIEAIVDQTYSGSPIEPTLLVKDGGTTLTQGTDYTVSYTSNTAVGTATAWVTFKGNYTGSTSANFLIKAPVGSFAVTFNSNGGSSVNTITNVASGSSITKPVDPTKTEGGQQLSFLGWYKEAELTNQWNFNTDKVTANITLYAKWSGWQPPTGTDTRFATGYPKATTDVQGNIVLNVKMASPSEAEIFMVVNQINAQSGGTVSSTDVIHGHGAAQNGHITYIDAAPYIKISDTSEHTIPTGIKLSTDRGAKIYLVVKDSTSTTATPLMLEYAKGTAAASVDTTAPDFMIAYINKSKTKVTLYFDELLDTSSIPAASAFSISSGTDTVNPHSVAIVNEPDAREGTVKLTFNEPITLTDSLEVSYTKPPSGNAIQDNATTPNKVMGISNESVNTVNMTVKSVTVSNDGQYLFVITNAVPWMTNFDISVKYGANAGSATSISSNDYTENSWYSTNGSGAGYYIIRNTVPSLTSGHKYFVTLTPFAGAVDYAGDTVTAPLTAEGTPGNEAVIAAPTAVYSSNAQTLTLTYPSDLALEGDSFSCFFTVTNGIVTYNIRHMIYLRQDSNTTLTFSTDKINFIPEDFWSDATISYGYTAATHTWQNANDIFTHPSGKPYEGFSNVRITVQ